MPANNLPIFTSIPDIQWAFSAVTANTTKDLTSGTIYLCFSASTNGGFVQRMRFRSLGQNNAQIVARVWINNGSSTNIATNNILWDEITLPTTTLSETAAQTNFELPLNFALPPFYTLYLTIGTAPNAAGWDAIVIGGEY